jgi:dihydropteroate synthase
VDTYKAEVMQAALDEGADIVNDVWALRQNGALAVVAQHPRCGVCLMHMHRGPQTMQVAPMQGDVIEPVKAFLRERAQAVRDAGVADSRIVLDPGIGFGKTVEQNFELLSRQSALLDLGWPVLAGWSRKSSLGSVTGQSVAADRVAASVAAAVLALERGARVLRVHDVAQTVQAAAVWRAAQAR